ncbi:hypothetical protein [Paracoccus marinus]|uniref:hypothetical protein n=1 Tax=Paracoccus marinus TaxID=288426 RepID=UPI00103D06D8|nr:hypothetical protein [Paracoccus marinus]GLS79938.1 hypothetical protein GCM10007893_07130 [Paracoccus marinus]
MIKANLPERVGEREQAVVARVVSGLDHNGLLVLGAWTTAMMQIRNMPIARWRKAQLALRATFASKATWPIVKLMAKALKSSIRSASGTRLGRTGLVGAAALALFGGQGAGVAALGGAIAVPLWIVVGGGYAFAEALQAGILLAAEREPSVSKQP